MPGKKASEEVRREQIIQAAFRVAACEGLEQLTMHLVAAEAGLSKGLLFFHFKSKEALLLALLDWLLDTIFETWQVPENLPPVERLLAWLRLDLQDLAQEKQEDALHLFFSYRAIAAHDPIIDERIQGALERSRQTLLPIVQAVIESEPRRFCQVAPEELASVVLAITQGSAIQSLFSNHSVDVERTLSVVRALLLPSVPGDEGR